MGRHTACSLFSPPAGVQTLQEDGCGRVPEEEWGSDGGVDRAVLGREHPRAENLGVRLAFLTGYSDGIALNIIELGSAA